MVINPEWPENRGAVGRRVRDAKGVELGGEWGAAD